MPAIVRYVPAPAFYLIAATASLTVDFSRNEIGRSLPGIYADSLFPISLTGVSRPNANPGLAMAYYNPLCQGEMDSLSESDYSQIAASPLDDLDDANDKRGRRSPNLEHQSASWSSDAMDHPRTVSREGSVLRHPAPDLQSIQGAYLSNVERLERSAERLSLSSSGIGEEIRKMREEQRKSDSRRSSVLNSPTDEGNGSNASPPRQASYGYGSHVSSSIVGINSVARSGGFSPAGYVASPRGSVRSGSWSQHASVKERSASYGPRLTQLSEPEQEGKPLDSPISSRLVPLNQEPETPASPLRVVNHESYNLDDVEIPHTQSAITDANHEPEPRPSTDTYRQTNGLFADFDGVHTEYHSDGQVEPDLNANRMVSHQSRPASRVMSYIEPPPGENMVYYPAPVPMMLNLPKRLSKLPQAAVRDKRRSELLGSLPMENRKSAAWLPDMTAGSDEGAHRSLDSREELRPHKRRTIVDMPPQLRATMFFDQPSVRHDIELKGESAVKTLDSILDASAFAPVSAFTDHPFVGQAGADVYNREAAGSRASFQARPQKRRSTINLLTHRNSSTDLLEDTKKSPNVLRKRNSNPNLLGNTRSRNSSMLSLGDWGKRKSNTQQSGDSQDYHAHETADGQAEDNLLQTPVDDHEVVATEEAYFHDDSEAPGEQVVDEEVRNGDFVGAPTTLLAELQMRKQQQRLRNRTAATAFPNGIHSTLLQLDAVDQVQKQKRKQQHTKLAWEDPNAQHPGIENEDDEDVPLGVLYAGRQISAAEKSRRLDEERPLGLIAMRQLEDNEPLSHRRARLREDLRPRPASPDKRNSMYTLDLPNFSETNLANANPTAPVADDNENETLGQRLRRLKATQIPVEPRPVSGDFASEMMSQFGAPSPSSQPPLPQQNGSGPRPSTKTPDPEETLGQRRKRLQAEAAQNRHPSTDSTPQQSSISKRRSMADILQAHPAAGAGSTMRVLSNEIKFAPATKTRNTPWAIHQTRQASLGAGVPMASGLGIGAGMAGDGVNGNGGYAPHPMVQKAVEVESGRREMIDRWRQSVHY